MPKFSIIIPVYNTQLYLEECLNSVLNQTFNNIQVICIDDHSVDNSLKILKEYKGKDDRISIIELYNNYGPGYARNQGINIANGEYILFLDSDDYLDTETLNTILSERKINDVDILIFNGQAFDHNLSKIYKNKYFNIEADLFEDNYLNVENIQKIAGSCHSPCMKIYKSSFIKKNKIYFPVSIVGEDVEFWIKCLMKTKSISYFNYIGYFRRYRDGSIMTSNLLKNLRDRIDNFDSLLNITQDNTLLYNYIFSYISMIMSKVYRTNDQELRMYFQTNLKLLSEKYD